MNKYFLFWQNEEGNGSKVPYPNEKNYIMPLNHQAYHMSHGIFESELIEKCCKLWKEKKGRTFLDVGSHTGTYSINLSPYFKKVIAFEPQKMTYYALCGSIALNSLTNINTYNIGLGSIEQRGMKNLFINSEDGGSSSLFGSERPMLDTEMVTIDVADKFMKEPIDFIKVDIEGNELNFFRGCATILFTHKPIILFECNTSQHLTDISNFLKEYNYKIEKENYNMYWARFSEPSSSKNSG